MAKDIFYPSEIENRAIGPLQGSGNNSADKSYPTQVYKPQTDVANRFPPHIVAHETISQSLDTKAKKIKGEYGFNKEGAIKIGEYVNGESGEVAISPNGIVATNLNGDTTVSIDGTTGDATFKGTVQAGSVISGNITVGGSGNGDGILLVKNASGTTIVTADKDGITVEDGVLTVKNDSDVTVIDAKGLVSTASFTASSVTGSSTQSTNSTTYVDVTGLSISFSLDRTQKVLLFAGCLGASLADNILAGCVVQLLIDSTVVGADMSTPGRYYSGSPGWIRTNAFTQEVLSLSSGSHTLKLQFRTTDASYAASISRSSSVVGYVILGS